MAVRMRLRIVLHNIVSLDGRIDLFPADVGLYYELAGRWPALECRPSAAFVA
jgi:hypothetical protein